MLERKEVFLNKINKLKRCDIISIMDAIEINSPENAIKYFFCLIRLAKLSHQSIIHHIEHDNFSKKIESLNLHLYIPESTSCNSGKRKQTNFISLLTHEGLELANNQELHKKRSYTRQYKSFHFNELETMDNRVSFTPINTPSDHHINNNHNHHAVKPLTKSFNHSSPVTFFNIPPSLAYLAKENVSFHQIEDIFTLNGYDEPYAFNYPIDDTDQDVPPTIYTSENKITFFNHQKSEVNSEANWSSLSDISSDAEKHEDQIDSDYPNKKFK